MKEYSEHWVAIQDCLFHIDNSLDKRERELAILTHPILSKRYKDYSSYKKHLVDICELRNEPY